MVQTILVVDDEADVRTVVANILRRAGFSVLETDSPRSAVEILRNGNVTLLVSDVCMPEMTGPELVSLARETNSGLPAVLVTGSNPSLIPPAILKSVQLVLKPFKASALIQAVKLALGMNAQESGENPDLPRKKFGVAISAAPGVPIARACG